VSEKIEKLYVSEKIEKLYVSEKIENILQDHNFGQFRAITIYWYSKLDGPHPVFYLDVYKFSKCIIDL